VARKLRFSSQQKRRRAAKRLVPVKLFHKRADGETVLHDGCIRPDSTLQALSELQPVFLKNGSVTAGTSSPLTDGAAAVLVCSEAYADAHGLEKIARIKAIAVSGCAPEIMGIGPSARPIRPCNGPV
jgi:acetyl-CoA acyltransferase